MSGRRGLFLTIEGVDGTGKSTQARLLARRLATAGQAVVLTREPGGAPGAEEIRRLLVSGEPGRWSAETEMLLFTAARRDHVERVIGPALEAARTVVCDRYVDSTRAYQGGARERARVDALHDLMIGLDPDLTLVLDLPPDAALTRAQGRSPDGSENLAPEDRFERRGLAFQERLRDAFLAIARADPARCRVIDAAGTEDEVAARIWAAFAEAGGVQ